MIATEIKKIVQIRNDEIDDEIKNIKNIYNICVTNELLEKFVIFSLEAINYYNKKYNYFTGDEYGQLYIFYIKQFNYYSYNILTSALYENKKYMKFKNEINLDDNQIYKLYIKLGNIIMSQITNITNRNNYKENIIHEDIQLEMNKFKNIELPYQEKCLLISYLYYFNGNIQMIKEKIKEDLLNITYYYNFLEEYIFKYKEVYKKTNAYIDFYFKSIQNNNILTTIKIQLNNILRYLK